MSAVINFLEYAHIEENKQHRKLTYKSKARCRFIFKCLGNKQVEQKNTCAAFSLQKGSFPQTAQQKGQQKNKLETRRMSEMVCSSIKKAIIIKYMRLNFLTNNIAQICWGLWSGSRGGGIYLITAR